MRESRNRGRWSGITIGITLMAPWLIGSWLQSRSAAPARELVPAGSLNIAPAEMHVSGTRVAEPRRDRSKALDSLSTFELNKFELCDVLACAEADSVTAPER